jgi:hypothetical protein
MVLKNFVNEFYFDDHQFKLAEFIKSIFKKRRKLQAKVKFYVEKYFLYNYFIKGN